MKPDPRNLPIADFDYSLPPEKIAVYPLEQRDQARLLQYKDKSITDHFFYDLPNQLPSNSWLLFNQTKVIPARLVFEKITGGQIEVFCLEPVASLGDMNHALNNTHHVSLHCLVGGASKWKKDTPLYR